MCLLLVELGNRLKMHVSCFFSKVEEPDQSTYLVSPRNPFKVNVLTCGTDASATVASWKKFTGCLTSWSCNNTFHSGSAGKWEWTIVVVLVVLKLRKDWKASGSKVK
jgi:hypothetical protein